MKEKYKKRIMNKMKKKHQENNGIHKIGGNIKRKKSHNNTIRTNDDFMYYPEFEDPKFYEKIFLKKEFRKGIIPSMKNKKMEDVCGKLSFDPFPQQIFLRNYISEETPYNGILIFHGTGVGKTCTAVGIAEGLKNQVQKMNRKIQIILKKNLLENFISTIYDLSRESRKKRPDDFVQCTGNTYTLGPEYDVYTIEQKLKQIRQNIQEYYRFITYDRFANNIMKEFNWDGKPSNLTQQIESNIRKVYSNTVFIIDEVHNIKMEEGSENKKVPPILETIIRLGENNRLVMLSATPMYDKPEEIIYLLNLLLQNDKRPPIRTSDIFTGDGEFKPDGRELLAKISRGYISFLRSENPITDPVRVTPDEAKIVKVNETIYGDHQIMEKEQMKYTNLILTEMSEYQTEGYLSIFEQIQKKKKIEKVKNVEEESNSIVGYNNKNKNEDDDEYQYISEENRIFYEENMESNEEEIEQKRDEEKLGSFNKFIYAANIIYPTVDGHGVYWSSLGSGIEHNIPTGNGGLVLVERENPYTKQKKIFYRYQDHAIFNRGQHNEKPFLAESNLKTYSIKLWTLLHNIHDSTGIVFIYSRYVEPGVIPICLMLEQNGYERYDVGTQGPMLDYGYNKVGSGGKSKPICYLCNDTIDAAVHKKKHPEYHEFHSAKYVLLKGESQHDDSKKMDVARVKEIVNNPRNIYGRDIKIIIGTIVAGEGIDFHNIRQIHIMEPWWNNSRIDQIIGRGIRYCSHSDLPVEERNVEVFQYAVSLVNKTKKINKTLKNLIEEYGNRETIDEYIYRIAEEKERKIKEVEYELRRVSIDCIFYKNTNFIETNRKIQIITSRGEKMTVTIGDQPYSKACFYRKNCKFECAWEPEMGKKYDENDDTYQLYFAHEDIRKLKKDIKKLYQKKIVYTINDILKYYKKWKNHEKNGNRKEDNKNEVHEIDSENKLDNFLIYKVLDDFVKNKESIYDSYGREGYLIYRGKYYIYQPRELKDETIPTYYRSRPLLYKPNIIEFEEKDLKIIEKKKETSVTIYTNKIYDTIIELYRKIYKILEKWIVKQVWNEYNYIVLMIVIDRYDHLIVEDFLKDIFIKYNHELIKQKKIEKKNNRENGKNNENDGNEYMVMKKVVDSYEKYDEYFRKNEIGEIIEFKWLMSRFVWNEKIKEWIKNDIKIKKFEKKNFHNIYGYLSKNKKGIYQLKLVDKTQDLGSITIEKRKSERTEITGRVCETFQVDFLVKFLEKIGMKIPRNKIESSKLKNVLCILIEFILRKQNETDKRRIWFESDETRVKKKRVRKVYEND
jgi:hypothetical protein